MLPPTGVVLGTLVARSIAFNIQPSRRHITAAEESASDASAREKWHSSAALVDRSEREHICVFNSSEWQDYKMFHDAGRQALMRGEQRPILLWRCHSHDKCGGTGDCLRGLTTAFYLAVATKRIFFIDWAKCSFNFTNWFAPRFIDWRMPAVQHVCRGNEPKVKFNGIIDFSKIKATWNAQCINVCTNLGFWLDSQSNEGPPF